MVPWLSSKKKKYKKCHQYYRQHYISQEQYLSHISATLVIAQDFGLLKYTILNIKLEKLWLLQLIAVMISVI